MTKRSNPILLIKELLITQGRKLISSKRKAKIKILEEKASAL